MEVEQHNSEIDFNRQVWDRKKLIRILYTGFHRIVKRHLSGIDGKILELGSGIAKIKETIPNCICTDLFPNESIDQVENAYDLSFENNSVSNLIAIDVFHHLRYPGTALKEWGRVLKPGARVILFEPGMGIVGRFVYDRFHHEPIALKDTIIWSASEDWDSAEVDYYAAQGNAYRIFFEKENKDWMRDWNLVFIRRYSYLSYLASGGFSGKQLYPTFLLGCALFLDQILDLFPSFSCSRLLIVLEKK